MVGLPLGVHCEEDIDECGSSPCLHNATCEDGVDQYTCYCKNGFNGESPKFV